MTSYIHFEISWPLVCLERFVTIQIHYTDSVIYVLWQIYSVTLCRVLKPLRNSINVFFFIYCWNILQQYFFIVIFFQIKVKIIKMYLVSKCQKILKASICWRRKNIIQTKFFGPPRMLTLLSFKSITIGVNTCLNRTPLSGFIRCHTFLSSFPKELLTNSVV